jgi:type IV pilus assembly protein PilY1
VDTVTVDRADNVLFDLAGGDTAVMPITAAPTVAVAKKEAFDIDASGTVNVFDRQRWVFFGTGRFIVGEDAADNSQQSYYGIKEPFSTSLGFTWEKVLRDTLLDSTNIKVRDDRTIKDHPLLADGSSWENMIELMENGTYKGWHVNFQEAKERNLGQAALLGGLLTFTTYKPSTDICLAEGSSSLYARWYQTGTPYYAKIFKKGNNWVDDPINPDGIADRGETEIVGKTDLGTGMAMTPNIHIGREEGSTAYIQTSTGDIITIEQEGGQTKSHKTDWLQMR